MYNISKIQTKINNELLNLIDILSISILKSLLLNIKNEEEKMFNFIFIITFLLIYQ